ncbi:tryptophan halogenase family protein [Sphingomonas sp. LHG3406-1]|uniref:tryptophan halogenase family protein n=1 Tax=Sphingomonas sp. LHG3406-1 TaxID=2804617 RepID=UPI0026160571|nr:tryptophan halogenase family protein [Sphingomonas sp. LHG3406-1]
MSEAGPLRHIVIVGGGTAGWMAAAALARLTVTGLRITLVESDAIGTVGVGEATIPPIRTFNAMIGLDENDFLRRTGGTFKLGIEFVDWWRKGTRYMHPFGQFGGDMDGVSFHQFWLRHAEAVGVPFEAFNLCAVAARLGRFQRPDPDVRKVQSTLNHAYHFDAVRYAELLREHAEARGVVRREGRIAAVPLHGENGFVEAVVLDTGERIEGDLFIDCSGFRGLLIEEALGSGYEDWRRWLPCDRAVALPTVGDANPLPYTRATALAAGWSWRIPLQHRNGTGYVYCSAALSDDQAAEVITSRAEGEIIGDPRLLRFTPGRRRKMWNRNVVALGLASGFIEPLESTSIHLIQAGISKLLAMLPDRGFNPVLEEEYNRLTQRQIEQVRDFVILHYKANERSDTDFWRQLAGMHIPDGLMGKITLFEENGRIFRHEDDLFSEASWVAVMLGQGVRPRRLDPLAATAGSAADQEETLRRIGRLIRGAAEVMPTHRRYLDQHRHAAGPFRRAGPAYA